MNAHKPLTRVESDDTLMAKKEMLGIPEERVCGKGHANLVNSLYESLPPTWILWSTPDKCLKGGKRAAEQQDI